MIKELKKKINKVIGELNNNKTPEEIMENLYFRIMV